MHRCRPPSAKQARIDRPRLVSRNAGTNPSVRCFGADPPVPQKYLVLPTQGPGGQRRSGRADGVLAGRAAGIGFMADLRQQASGVLHPSYVSRTRWDAARRGSRFAGGGAYQTGQAGNGTASSWKLIDSQLHCGIDTPSLDSAAALSHDISRPGCRSWRAKAYPSTVPEVTGRAARGGFRGPRSVEPGVTPAGIAMPNTTEAVSDPGGAGRVEGATGRRKPSGSATGCPFRLVFARPSPTPATPT